MSKRIKLQAIPINRTDYCQFLIVSQKNYSLTYYAEHAKKCSHDVINRFLRNEKYTPSLLWEHIKNDVIFSSNGYTIFDDTVLNKRNTKQIEIARSQYSGATGRVTKGIGVVSLVYYNPDINKFWVIDYRIFAPDHDGARRFLFKQYFLTHGILHTKLCNMLTLWGNIIMPLLKPIETLVKRTILNLIKL
ncbi:hypothetical protein [Rickettsia endosymbiont of Gonocerus acuteangulatus]|uniref:hypothetical protein n=1 Tax=Rickettsia endosymbiont of Gonocerus acuteangulatus TaxID=3066266 RepID=UPI003132E2C1